MSKIGNKWFAWFKFLNGVFGVAATVVILITMVGSTTVITIGGVQVAGSVVFTMILFGNTYGMCCLAKEGHSTLMKHRAIKRKIAGMHEAWETTTKWNENDNEDQEDRGIARGIKWPRK